MRSSTETRENPHYSSDHHSSRRIKSRSLNKFNQRYRLGRIPGAGLRLMRPHNSLTNVHRQLQTSTLLVHEQSFFRFSLFSPHSNKNICTVQPIPIKKVCKAIAGACLDGARLNDGDLGLGRARLGAEGLNLLDQLEALKNFT